MLTKRLLPHQRLQAYAQQMVLGALFRAFAKSQRAMRAMVAAFSQSYTPLEIAKRKTALLDRAAVEDILSITEVAAKQLAKGELTHDSFSMLKTAHEMSQAIEDDGEIRGLQGHITAADTALQSIYNRCMQGNESNWTWTPRACTIGELDAVREFVAAHRFQIENILRVSLSRINRKLFAGQQRMSRHALSEVERKIHETKGRLKDYELNIPRLVAA